MQERHPTPEAEAAVGRAVDALGSLPVLSGTVLRVIQLSDDPESSTGDLVSAMESDEAFAANLLRFANSAHNARPIRASTVRQAVTLIGRPRADAELLGMAYAFEQASRLRVPPALPDAVGRCLLARVRLPIRRRYRGAGLGSP